MTSSNDTVIRVAQLSKKFGQFNAVDNLSFDVQRGEIFGFLGPNGAGKTTTISMICGLLEPTSGSIAYFENSDNKKQQSLHRFGLCPQENIFWPSLTCYEQLTFMGTMYGQSRKQSEIRAIELLEWLGLRSKSHVLAAKLSGGMKRRLNICLALVHDPPLLILDEPEAGLDPQTRILVREFIKGLAETKTIILTTHNMDEADRLSDRVAIVDHGNLLMLDSPETLKHSIGEGDLIEIRLESIADNEQQRLQESLFSLCEKVTINNSTIHIRALHVIEKVSKITTQIQKQGLRIKEITMRENTLEDVFINLTGRKLRQ